MADCCALLEATLSLSSGMYERCTASGLKCRGITADERCEGGDSALDTLDADGIKTGEPRLVVVVARLELCAGCARDEWACEESDAPMPPIVPAGACVPEPTTPRPKAMGDPETGGVLEVESGALPGPK
jgi:hypothetical protein